MRWYRYYHFGLVDQGVMAMKRYSTFPKAPGLNLTIKCSLVGDSLGVGVLLYCRDAVDLFLKPHLKGQCH